MVKRTAGAAKVVACQVENKSVDRHDSYFDKNKKCEEAWLAQANTELQWKFPLNRLKSSPRLRRAPPQGSSAGSRVNVKGFIGFEFLGAMGA